MVAPLAKRRKVEHVSPDDREEDDASFASFGDHGHETGLVGGARAGAGEDVSEDDEEDGSEDDEEEEAEEQEGGEESGVEDESEEEGEQDEATAATAKHTSTNGKTLPTTKPARDGRSTSARTAAAAAQNLGGGAYSANTFKSNIFKLQVDELLQQLRPRRGRREEAAEQALHTLKKRLEATPARAPLGVVEGERALRTQSGVVVPFPHPRPAKDARYKLEYARPSRINVVGSHALQTAARAKDQQLEIDMTLTMPAALFQDKDYLNHRYFYKRAYYLACVAAELQSAGKEQFAFAFEDFRGEPLKPVLVVTPRQSAGAAGEAKPVPRWQINIIPCIGAEVFARDKLRPEKNCVRPEVEGSANEPTPRYNSSLRADMLTNAYLQLLHTASKSCAAFNDACLLGTTWLRQRGFASNLANGGFGSFEWSALIALLLQGGGPGGKALLSAGYSSYQLFKATLQLLAVRDLSKQVLSIGSDSDTIKAVGHDSPAVWDSSRSHNILYKTLPWAYKLLRQEASVTLRMLGDQNFDSFDATFITRADNPLLRFDFTVGLPLLALGVSTSTHDHAFPTRFTDVYEKCLRGLGDRVKEVGMSLPRRTSWGLSSTRSDFMDDSIVKLGLVVNPDTANRTVDHGPSAEDKVEAASFRKFWGDRAELRRFKDGSILESLIWQPSTSGQTVIEQLLRHVLGRHFGARAGDELRFAGNESAMFVKQSQNNVAYQPLAEAYKKLEHDIRSLEDLPLSIRALMPADAQLRNTSIALPVATNSAGQRPVPADLTIQFEGSARWPDDLAAIQRTKIAFLLKLGDLLSANREIETRLGLENEPHDVLNQGFLEISYSTAATFRLRIHHEREQTLFERQLKDKSAGPQAKEAAAKGLALYKRDYIKTPAHTQAIARLCSRHPTLSGSIRLMKKWFASHLLVNHFSEEVIELLVARTFVQPYPWKSPASVQTGFLRTLRWLARWDWRTEPLIVDLSGTNDLKPTDRQAIQSNFEAWRKLDPGLNRVAIFTASNVDHDGTTYTDGRPAKVVAGRMTSLAKAAAAELDEKKLTLEPAALFHSPLLDFDFMLHLHTPERKSGDQRFKNLQLDVDDTLIGLDLTREYLTELEHVYGSSICFFSGGVERHVIAGLWSPQTARRNWKVNLSYSIVPTKTVHEDEVQAEINKEAVLAEMARLGGDLVRKIEVNR
nr:u3 small nucleolar rna-associated protein 22 [Quercus suber]